MTQINSVEFNRVCSVLATTEGLFEVDIQEMPNMVRAKGLPRQIVHPQLHEAFTMARDPLVLGIHPAMAIVAKTKDDRVCVWREYEARHVPQPDCGRLADRRVGSV